MTVRRVVLASGNPGKLKELQSLLGDGLELRPQSDFDIVGVEETGATFEENALLKARHAAAISGLPAIADDSGLEVDALGGAPGVRSARYAGEDCDDQANNDKLLRELGDVAGEQRRARFRAVVVYVDSADDHQPLIAEGTWEGFIAHEPRGSNGFGYDPLFFDGTAHRTSAELDPQDKNARSHRGKAVRRLRELLN
ncbi:MAG: RdgB/HAM1 family non-canonical purine NTP pyrophosphatase [Gammaproteobacteria bacterium]|nr:RdgB/HAM1 family non-canonical purine NTP pyrophosphatase [Gammaproteobacteria bacterium]MBT8444011.1 RdgB/HAM1 family non-canonical purine NTP pyrophosphatase [Gammaproteobacteria bacterium]